MSGRSGYPSHWEADVLLADGTTAQLLPLRPTDRAAVRALLDEVSPESLYNRFFTPRPALSERDVRHLVEIDQDERVALAVWVRGRLVAVGRFDRVAPGSERAEVAFLVTDRAHGLGLGSVLLEHLAQCARELGVVTFLAEVLTANVAMIRVFARAGFDQRRDVDADVVEVRLDIHPTEHTREVVLAREHRAEVRSIGRFLRPQAVALVGDPASGWAPAMAAQLADHGFDGQVVVSAAGASLAEAPVPDLVVLAGGSEHVLAALDEAGRAGAHGVVLLADDAPAGGHEAVADHGELVRRARHNGLRLLGPRSIGLVTTHEHRDGPDAEAAGGHQLALTTGAVPAPGSVGVFCQSAPLARDLLARCARRALGVSTFVSAGDRADISGNDLLQYFLDDEQTRVVALHLESVGNPGKFTRLARQLAHHKPVLAVRSGLTARRVPRSHAVEPVRLTNRQVDDIYDQLGVVRVGTASELVDVAALLEGQPWPQGRRVAVLAEDDATTLAALDAVASADLQVATTSVDASLARRTALEQLAELARRRGRDDQPERDVDAVLLVLSAPAGGMASVERAVQQAMAQAGVPVLAALLGVGGLPPEATAPHLYGSVEEAVRTYDAAARAVAATERDLPLAEPVDSQAVAAARAALRGGRGVPVADQQTWADVLQHTGVAVLPRHPVASLAAAVAALRQIQADEDPAVTVVLKATRPALRGRPDLANARRHIATAADMRRAWRSLTATLDRSEDPGLVVQRMVEPGVAVTLQVEDVAGFGHVMSVGLAGVISDVIGDTCHGILPASKAEAVRMLRRLRAYPLLAGTHAAEPIDIAPLAEAMVRVGHLVGEIRSIRRIHLDPVLLTPAGLVALAVDASLRRAPLGGVEVARRMSVPRGSGTRVTG
jgi:acyl-CoA synthetase (NDP forming)/GNAT superfamily N-acetyltransferase